MSNTTAAMTIDDVVAAFDFQFTHLPSKREGMNARLEYRALVTKKGSNRVVYDGPYSLGLAHVPGYDKIMAATNSSYRRLTLAGAAAIDEILSTGKYPSSPGKHDIGFVRTKLPGPKPADVIHSLLMDGDADDCRDFEEWASNYGYDSDSISALRTYEVCCQIGRTLRTEMGVDWLKQARDAFRDY